MNALTDFFLDYIMPVIVIAALFVLLVMFGWLLWSYFNPAPSISLTKDDWTCTAKERRSSTVYVKSGSVFVPITNYHNHCVQWTER